METIEGASLGNSAVIPLQICLVIAAARVERDPPPEILRAA